MYSQLIETQKKRNTILGNHRWTNRAFPPLVLVIIVAGVWYSAVHRSDPIATPISASALPTKSSPIVTLKTTQVTSLPLPTITKVSGHMQLSIDTTNVPQIQKVEFYIGNQLVGAAFSTPYTMTLEESNLRPGTHQLTAKVYTMDSTTQSPPVNFVSQQDATNTTPITSVDSTSTPINAAPVQTSTNTVQIPNPPTNVSAKLQVDGSVVVSWSVPVGGVTPVSYQVWQGPNEIGSTTTTDYIDNATVPGGTYDYQVVAVDSSNNASDYSSTVAITVPASQQSSGSNDTTTDTNSASAQPQSLSNNQAAE